MRPERMGVNCRYMSDRVVHELEANLHPFCIGISLGVRDDITGDLRGAVGDGGWN